ATRKWCARSATSTASRTCFPAGSNVVEAAALDLPRRASRTFAEVRRTGSAPIVERVSRRSGRGQAAGAVAVDDERDTAHGLRGPSDVVQDRRAERKLQPGWSVGEADREGSRDGNPAWQSAAGHRSGEHEEAARG